MADGVGATYTRRITVPSDLARSTATGRATSAPASRSSGTRIFLYMRCLLSFLRLHHRGHGDRECGQPRPLVADLHRDKIALLKLPGGDRPLHELPDPPRGPRALGPPDLLELGPRGHGDRAGRDLGGTLLHPPGPDFAHDDRAGFLVEGNDG